MSNTAKQITRQIESTGHKQTIEQREEDAAKHLIHSLARIEQQCHTLGHDEAAKHCRNAIKSLRWEG
jgi:hypothetical protein